MQTGGAIGSAMKALVHAQNATLTDAARDGTLLWSKSIGTYAGFFDDALKTEDDDLAAIKLATVILNLTATASEVEIVRHVHRRDWEASAISVVHAKNVILVIRDGERSVRDRDSA